MAGHLLWLFADQLVLKVNCSPIRAVYCDLGGLNAVRVGPADLEERDIVTWQMAYHTLAKAVGGNAMRTEVRSRESAFGHSRALWYCSICSRSARESNHRK